MALANNSASGVANTRPSVAMGSNATRIAARVAARSPVGPRPASCQAHTTAATCMSSAAMAGPARTPMAVWPNRRVPAAIRSAMPGG